MSFEAGSIWWCDGVALGFEFHFKRRPVLLVGRAASGMLLVVPLSSRRRYGQEREVVHNEGVSYLTGALLEVPEEALLRSLGDWAGFAAWRGEQQAASEGGLRWRAFLSRLRRALRRGS